MAHRHRLVFALGVLLTGLPLTSEAVQISPNPNPAGSTIDIINDPNAFNNVAFINEGTINIDATSTLTNLAGAGLRIAGDAHINNRGTFINQTGGALGHGGNGNPGYIDNSGMFINNGDSFIGVGLTVTNSGTLINTGSLHGYSFSLDNANTLMNSGSIGFTASGGLGNTGTVMNSGAMYCGESGFSGNSSTFINSGRLTVNGIASFRNGVGSSFMNTGKVDIAPGYLLNDGTMTNAGAITLSAAKYPSYSGTLDNTGTLTNVAGSTLTLTGVLTPSFINARVNNTGTMVNEAGSVQTVDAFGQLTNRGTLTHAGAMTNDGLVQNGAVDRLGGTTTTHSGTFLNTGSITGTGAYAQLAGQTINNGTLTQTGSARFFDPITGTTPTVTGVTILGGSLSGLGTINAPLTLASGASLSPGTTDQLGTFTLNGNLASSGNLAFRFGGLNAGEFDVLKVNGTASFTGGNLVLNFVNGFTAAVGNSWKFLSASALSGWDSLLVRINGLAAGLGYEITSVNGAQTLTITGAPVPVPEPSSLLLLGVGLAGLIGFRRKLSHHINEG